MRIHLLLLAATALGTTAIAQNNRVELQGKQTSFTSRGNVGTGTGEIHQGFHSSYHAEMAATNQGTTSEIKRLYLVHQDQNCSSQEKYDLAVRSGTDALGPTGGTAPGAILGEVLNLNVPSNTSTGACAWGSTITLAATAPIKLNMDQFFSLGVRFTPSPNWTMDGHSVHTSFGSAAYPHQNSSNETLTTGQADHAWQLPGTATVATHPSDFRTWRLGFDTDATVMQLGCGTGSIGYGMGGMFPRSSTSSAPLGLHLRIRGGSSMSGAAGVGVLAPAGLFPIAIPLGSHARLRLNPAAVLIFAAPAANGNGEAVIALAPFIPQVTPAPAPGTKFPFQAAQDSGSTGLRLTNVQFCEPGR